MPPDNLIIPQAGRLRVEPGPCPDKSLLRFALDAPSTGSAGCGLDWLGGDLREECWLTGWPVSAGRRDEVAWRRAGDLLFLNAEWPDDAHSDPAAAAETAYRELLAVAAEQGCREMLRAWNYLPAINAGVGDAERYRRFCLGRAVALKAAGYGDGELCAGTAIGSDEDQLRIYLLCGAQSGVNIENPRQLSAYRYPREYGPSSPSFARATALDGGPGQALLMISGTASVVGHRTLHVGDVAAQLEEIIRNLEILLSEAAERLERPEPADLNAESLLRVYLRHAGDWPLVERRLRQRWPEARLAGLRGDICRSDLLVEIEALVNGY